LLAGQRLSVSLTDLADLRLLEKIFKVQSLNAQLRHFGIQLLRLRHFRQARNLGAQRFAQQV
jgi:RIO-like serine/threonine protein kinase